MFVRYGVERFTLGSGTMWRLGASIGEPLTNPCHYALGDPECAVDAPAQFCLYLALAEDKNAWLLQKDSADANSTEAPH